MNAFVTASLGLALLGVSVAAQVRAPEFPAEQIKRGADLPLLLTRLAAKHPVRVTYFAGHWLDVDTLGDLAEARNFS